MLTKQEVSFFNDQGYLKLTDVLSGTEVARLRALADRELAGARNPATRGEWDIIEAEDSQDKDARQTAVYRLSRIMARHEAFPMRRRKSIVSMGLSLVSCRNRTYLEARCTWGPSWGST